VKLRPGQAPAPAATYSRQLTIHAPTEKVFGAIASLDGLRRWWTTVVTGSAVAGGTLRFGFAGLDEQIVMHVGTVRPPYAVTWSCTAHTRDGEWTGSVIHFELADRGPQACELSFRHTAIDADLVAHGWDRFLASLACYAEHGTGSPYGAPTAVPREASPAARRDPGQYRMDDQ